MSKKNRLTKQETSLCVDLASNLSQNFTQDDVKQLMSQWKKDVHGKELKTVPQLLALLQHIKFFEKESETAIATFHTKAPNLTPEMMATLIPKLKNLFEEESFQTLTAESMFNAFDTDKSKTLSFTEFATGFSAFSSGDPIERARVMFNAWDADGNGTLSRGECKKMFSKSFELSFKMSSGISNLVVMGVLAAQMEPLLEDPAQMEEFISRFKAILTESLELSLKSVQSRVGELVDKYFEVADTNHDNVLSLDEFLSVASDPALVAQVGEFSKELIDPAISDKIVAQIDDLFAQLGLLD